MSDLLKKHIENALEANFAYYGALRRRIEELEAQGRRVVGGGSIGADAWDVVDWRTDEILAAGSDGPDGLAAARRELDPDGRWIHVDEILEGDEATYAVTEGLPDGLANVIEDWALAEDAEEVADFIGWPAEKVEEYQADV